MNETTRILTGLVMAGALMLPCHRSAADLMPVALGSAAAFAVLAGDNVSSTGLAIVNGNLGSGPGGATAGFPPGTVSGTMFAGGQAAAQAEADLETAYNDAAGRPSVVGNVAGNISGQTLAPGIYNSSSSLAIAAGDLTLDAQNDPNAVWIFQIASTLTTGANSRVVLANGATAANVFWQVGSSATLDTATSFQGTIMAQASISLQTDTVLAGRALALTGSVTLDANVINNPSLIPPAPSFGPIQRAANGMVTLLITNTPGATLTLQTSSNLTSWTTIATLTPGATPDTFTDTTTPADTNRFYRAFYP